MSNNRYITEYVCVSAISAEKLTEEVNVYIDSEYWEPVGGVCSTEDGMYAQALVLWAIRE